MISYTVVSGSLRLVSDTFYSDRFTAVFCRIVNESKGSNTLFSCRLRQLLIVYGTTKNDRNTTAMKQVKYDRKLSFCGRMLLTRASLIVIDLPVVIVVPVAAVLFCVTVVKNK